MSRFTIILLLTLAAGNIAAGNIATTVVTCNQPGFILDTVGTLSIARSAYPCVFELSSTSAFMIKTDDLILQDGDTLKISHQDAAKATVTTSFKPPFDLGYLLINVDNPRLEFNFASSASNKSYDVPFTRYTQGETSYSLVVDCDINNVIMLKSYTFQEFKMQLTLKKTSQAILLEVSGATLETSETGYALYVAGDRDAEVQFIRFNGNETAIIKTSQATPDCSKRYQDSDPIMQQRVIKIETNHTEPYQCVWTFQGFVGSHYEIDFKDFLGLFNANDELIIVDNSTALKVSQTMAYDYFKRVISSRSRDLTIIYRSPNPATLKDTLFQLVVKETNSGGVFETNSKSSISITGAGNFTILPELHSYAAIELQGRDFSSVKMRIMSENNLVANFENSAILPSIIALNEKDKAMFLELTASKPEQLKNTLNMKSLEKSCHKLSKTNTDSFSISGNSTCFWTIASSSPALLRFDNLNLIPNGCLTIQPFDRDTPIYRGCNISGQLPPFIVRDAFVNITSASMYTRVDASVTPWLQEDVRKVDKPAASLNLTSNGYPLTYAIAANPEILSVNYTNQSYVLSVADVDLRSGEKLVSDKVELKQFQDLELISDGKSAAIETLTLTRPQIADDFSNHRGYRLLLSKFDRIVSVNQSIKKPIEIPQNLTNVYIKISSFSGSKVKVGNRIKFNSSNTSYMKVYDSKTLLLQGQPIKNNISTSDTIIITYQGANLPKITLDYEFVPCSNGTFACDENSRCIPNDLLCQGVLYCQDRSDIQIKCSAGPAPPPKVIEKGMSGTSVFFISIFMIIIGSLATLYGPNMYKSVEGRLRNGQYTSFTSTE